MNKEREEDSPVYVTRVTRNKIPVNSLLNFLGCMFNFVQRISERESVMIYLISQCGADSERIKYGILDHEYRRLKQRTEEENKTSLVHQLVSEIDNALKEEEKQYLVRRKIEEIRRQKDE